MYTLPTSTFVFRSGFPFRRFELEWSLVATSLEGFSVASHKERVPRAPFTGTKRVRGAAPSAKKDIKVVISKVVLSGLLSLEDANKHVARGKRRLPVESHKSPGAHLGLAKTCTLRGTCRRL